MALKAASDEVAGDDPASAVEIAYANYSYNKYLHDEAVAN